MVADGLYDKGEYGIPTPNIVLSQHLYAIKAGVVAISGGVMLTAVDSLEIRIFGKSGHISRLELCVDPALTASQIVVRLQSIVTKEVRPEEFAVIACASIHGGSTANIVPDFVDLKLSIRSYRPEVHDRLLTAGKRAVYAECEVSGSFHIHEPTFTSILQAPATINDSKHAEILERAFEGYFRDNTIDTGPFGASEDVSILATSCGAPLVHTTCTDAWTARNGSKPNNWENLTSSSTTIPPSLHL